MNTSMGKIPTPFLCLLTVEFDAQLIGGPSEGDATGGGWAWEGRAAEEDIGAECRFSHWVDQRRKALATVDTLIWQGTMEWAAAAERLTWWWFLAVLQRSYGWKWWGGINITKTQDLNSCIMWVNTCMETKSARLHLGYVATSTLKALLIICPFI